MARVFNKAISVAIAVFINPIICSEQVRPDAANELKIRGALIVSGCEHKKQRRGVDGSVVSLERDLFEFRHLSLSYLVQNLAWFRIVLRTEVGRLCFRQVKENAPRNL